jgi:hypothetical protein
LPKDQEERKSRIINKPKTSNKKKEEKEKILRKKGN